MAKRSAQIKRTVATTTTTSSSGRRGKKLVEEDVIEDEYDQVNEVEVEEEEEQDEAVEEEQDEVEEVHYNEDSIVYDTEDNGSDENNINSNNIKPEEIFYIPPESGSGSGRGRGKKSNNDINNNRTNSGGKTSKLIQDEMGEESWPDLYEPSRCQKISPSESYMRNELYTEQQLEQLSSEIRRHPSLAERSYHFLSFGISTKIQHQWIRVILSLLILFSLVAIVFYLPLPHLKHINLSPNGPSIESTKAEELFDPYSLKLTAFKDNWRRFSILGTSNFLCSNYNFNPLSPSNEEIQRQHIPKEFSSVQELKNLKIFGSCILFGITLFVSWLIAARLSEKEIIIKSNVTLQIIHSLLTIIIIPLITMILCSMILLYIVQTVLIGTQVNGREDTFYCVNRVSNIMSELGTLSPIRELFLGNVGIVVRIVNFFYHLPIESLALHDNADGAISDNEMKFVSFIWTIIIGSTIYHLFMIISYIYSIFHEQPSSSSTLSKKTSAGSAIATTAINTSDNVFDPDSLSLLKLDLKFLPSFIPEVLLTLNFIIVLVWCIVACSLWVFGIPPNLHIHEGEIFYIAVSLTPLIKSIYSLIIIDQKKDKIIRIHRKNTFQTEPEILANAININQ